MPQGMDLLMKKDYQFCKKIPLSFIFEALLEFAVF